MRLMLHAVAAYPGGAFSLEKPMQRLGADITHDFSLRWQKAVSAVSVANVERSCSLPHAAMAGQHQQYTTVAKNMPTATRMMAGAIHWASPALQVKRFSTGDTWGSRSTMEVIF